MGRCKWRKECLFDRIVDYEDVGPTRKYKVRWLGFGPEDDTWQTRGSIHHECIKEFEVANGIYDYDCLYRCPICDLKCKNVTGVKIHSTRVHSKATETNDMDKQQNFDNTLADEAVKTKKLSAQQKLRSTIF